MKHFLFHLMPYRELPDDFEERYESAWVFPPNQELFDPERGHVFYNEYIDELAAAEEQGFDGVCINEHHQNVYGLMPSPNIIASMLAMRTERVKIAIVGNALPLYDPPTRVAEEIAMLDCISGGRIISGMVIGGGPEYFSFSMNGAEARTRFAEAHDVIVGAWTKKGPWAFYGEHYKLRYVNTWPQPLQQPFPRIWIPGAGSVETMEYVAARRYSYMGIPYFHIDFFKKNYAMFRDICEKQEGYEAHPEQMGLLMPIYVSDTDEKARKEYEEHFWYFQKKLLPGILIAPPGYTSPSSAMRQLRAIEGGAWINSCTSWEDVEKGCYALVGSPETVAEKIVEHAQEIGCGNLLGLFQLGSMPHQMALDNAARYAEEVKPRVDEAIPDAAEPLPEMIPFPEEEQEALQAAGG